MGYGFYTTATDVTIRKADLPRAVELLHAAGFGKDEDSLDAILRNADWETAYNKEGDLTEAYVEDGRLRDDDDMWSTLAPVIEDGSHIDCVGEDGEAWRWAFNHGTMRDYSGTLVFEDDTDLLRELLAHAEKITDEG